VGKTSFLGVLSGRGLESVTKITLKKTLKLLLS